MQFKAALFFAAILLLFLQATTATSFSYDNPNFISNDFVAYGSGIINSTGLTVSQQGDAVGTIIFYNQPVLLANGFSTQFTIDITNCDASYNGADGFAFVLFPNQLPAPFSPPVGSAIGITDSSNLAAVGFVLVSDILTVCAVNSAGNFGHGSLITDTTHCVQNDTSSTNTMKNLRCSGPHTIGITFTSPAAWEITVDGIASYTFTKNILTDLNWNTADYKGFVGFSGGVAAGYMDQIITSWNLTTTAGCLATCDQSAQCDVFSNNNTVVCSCPSGYFGDGTSPCIPIRTNNVIPILECYESYGYGMYEAFYGYRSNESIEVAIPYGADNNYVGFDAPNLPQIFEPGRTPFYPSSAFSVEFESADPLTLTWHLGNYEVSFSSTDNSRLCPSNLTIVLQFLTSRQLDANETSLILDQLYNLLGISYGRLSVVNITYTPYTSKRQSTEELAELELEISGTNDTTSTEPRASQVVQKFVTASSNTTLMNEVVNPDTDNPDPARNFLDVKTTSSGTETLGQALPQPIAPIAPLAPQAPMAPSDVPTTHPEVPTTPSVRSAVPITSNAQSMHQILGNFVLFSTLVGCLLSI